MRLLPRLLLASLLFLALLVAPAPAKMALAQGGSTFSNSTPIQINDLSNPKKATPYPSQLQVSGLVGTITKVTVKLNDLTHSRLRDVDMLLAGPQGQAVMLLSDLGYTADHVSLTLDDAARYNVPDAPVFSSGTFRPFNHDATSDVFPAPAPTTVRQGLSTFNGTDPNGTWSLYIIDDYYGDSGALAGGWSLTITTASQFSNNNPITINSSGTSLTPANPYPSQIEVSGVPGVITNLSVRLVNFSHRSPDDVDILLVGPQGQNLVLMSDAGGAVAEGEPTPTRIYRFEDTSATKLADSTLSASGIYQPTNYGAGDTFPGAPAPSSATALSTFTGTNPNGIWSLYIVDDENPSQSGLLGGWSLNIVTGAPASNATAITINDSVAAPTIATPYPSAIEVSGLSGIISSVTVSLHGLTHERSANVDILLVGPQGQNIVLMSDVGGSTLTNNATLHFQDGAPRLPATDTPLVSGTYRPTNTGASDIFPTPSPAPSAATGLSIFKGTNPNGTWNLYVVDDVRVGAGSIAGGWSLAFTMAGVFSQTETVTINTLTPATPSPQIQVSGLSGVISDIEVQLSNFSHSRLRDLDLWLVAPTDVNYVDVMLMDFFSSTQANNVTLVYDDDAAAGIPDGPPVASGTYKPSGTQALSALHGTDPNGTWSLYVVDLVAGEVGRIEGGWSLTITTAPRFENSSPVTIADSTGYQTPGTASAYPWEIAVSGLTGTITDVDVRLEGLGQQHADDLDIMLRGPLGRKVMLMSDAGGYTTPALGSVVFDDNAPSYVGVLDRTKVYKPTNLGSITDVFPPPTYAPAPNSPNTLSTFNGTNPNFVWKLYAVDDADNNDWNFNNGVGTIGRWSLIITTDQGREIEVASSPTDSPGFTAEATSNQVQFAWTVAPEENVVGFNLYRSTNPDAPETQINDALIPSETLASDQSAAYEYVDNTAEAGRTYYYWLETVASDGVATRQNPVSVTLAEPTALTLRSVQAASGVGPLWAYAPLALATATGVYLCQRKRR